MSLGRSFGEIYDVKPALKLALDALIHAASQKEYQNISLVLSTLGNPEMTEQQVHVAINAKVKSGACKKHLMAISKEYFEIFSQHPEEKITKNPNVDAMLFLADRFQKNQVIEMDATVIEKLNAELTESSMAINTAQTNEVVPRDRLIKLKEILARFDKLIDNMERLPAVYWDNELCVNIFSRVHYYKESCCTSVAEIYCQAETQLEAETINEVMMLEYRVAAYAVLAKLILLLDKYPNKNLPSSVVLCQLLEKSSGEIKAFYKESLRIADLATRQCAIAVSTGNRIVVPETREMLRNGLEKFEKIEKAVQSSFSIQAPDKKFFSAILANKIGDFDLVGAVTYAYQMIEEQQGLQKTQALSDPVILLEANKEVAETLSTIFSIEENAYNLTPHSLSAFMKYYESLLVTFARRNIMLNALDKICKKYQYTSVNEVLLFDSILKGLISLSQVKPTGFKLDSSASKSLTVKSVELNRRGFLRVLSKMIPLLYCLNKTHFSSLLSKASAARIAEFGGGFDLESGLEGLLDKVQEQIKALPSQDKKPLTEKEMNALMDEEARSLKKYHALMQEYADKKKVELKRDDAPELIELETEIDEQREKEREEIKLIPTMSIAAGYYFEACVKFQMDPDAALLLYKKSLETAKASADHLFVAASMSEIASCYNRRAKELKKNNPLGAITEYARADAIAKEALQYYEEHVDVLMSAGIEMHSVSLHLQVTKCATDLAKWIGKLKAEKTRIDYYVDCGRQARMEIKSLRTEAEWKLGLRKDQQSVAAAEFDLLKSDQKNINKLVRQVEHVIIKMIPQAVCFRMLHDDQRAFPLRAYLAPDNSMQKLALTAKGDFSERLIFMRNKNLLSIASDAREKPLSLAQSGHCYFKKAPASLLTEPRPMVSVAALLNTP